MNGVLPVPPGNERDHRAVRRPAWLAIRARVVDEHPRGVVFDIQDVNSRTTVGGMQTGHGQPGAVWGPLRRVVVLVELDRDRQLARLGPVERAQPETERAGG